MYEPPTPAEVGALLARAGLSCGPASVLLNVDRRQVQRWRSGETPMPYATLSALLSLAFNRQPGPPENWRGAAEDLLSG
jgi:hypothetical protein